MKELKKTVDEREEELANLTRAAPKEVKEAAPAPAPKTTAQQPKSDDPKYKQPVVADAYNPVRYDQHNSPAATLKALAAETDINQERLKLLKEEEKAA